MKNTKPSKDIDNQLAVSGNLFFGKMSASATHEIKNTLSIINENAGLLEDLSMIAQNGQSLSPERISKISSTLKRQVHRSDLILKNLNQFSHSVDQQIQQVDLTDTTRFVLELSSRLIQLQAVTFNVTSPETEIKIFTNLFFCQNMLWNAIETACRLVSGEKCVTISYETSQSHKKINFSFDIGDESVLNNLFNSENEKALIAYLGIIIENKQKNTFGLIWPERI